MSIELTGEFKKVLDAVINKGQNVLLTGSAGTGKSVLSRLIVKNAKGNVAVAAPTGVAACNLRGQTIHSLFQFPPKPLSSYDLKFNRTLLELLGNIDLLVLDEISMVRADVFAAMDHSLKVATRNNAPFGGVQVVCVGDLSQLPPVVASDADVDLIEHMFGSRYFFSTEAYEKANFTKIELTKIFRQSDADFINFLNRVKRCDISDSDIEWFNYHTYGKTPVPGCINLVTTNATADRMNERALMEINAKSFTFRAIVDGTFDERNVSVPPILEIKEGCRMMTAINDKTLGVYNGSMGVVTSINDDDKDGISISMKMDAGHNVKIRRKQFDSIKYKYDKLKSSIDENVIGTFTQFPLRPCSAITVHRSQGLTFDTVNIDLGRATFDSGMSYVALSRCRTIEGISMARPLRRQDIYMDTAVLNFIKKEQHGSTTEKIA